MNSAEELFNELTGFKLRSDAAKTPQQYLTDYCRDVLGPVEKLNVDYKEKSDRRNSKLGDSDRKNLAKAVSGFANSSGGVLIWGIEDKTLKPKPISDVEQFLSNAVQLATQSVDPIVAGISAEWIPAESDPQSGFGLLYIPESSLPPHRVILKDSKIKDHYYLRSGDSFNVATHTQLEDMFGRRPKPVLSLTTRDEENPRAYEIVIGIRNSGRGAAKGPFLSVKLNDPYTVDSLNGLDGNGNQGLQQLVKSGRTKEHSFGGSADILIHPGVVLDITKIHIRKKSDIVQIPPDLIIDYSIAAEGIPPINGKVRAVMPPLGQPIEFIQEE